MYAKLNYIGKFKYFTDFNLTNYTYPTAELVYLIDGVGDIEINGINYKFTENSVCFLRAGEAKNQTCSAISNYIMLRFSLSDNNLDLPSGVYKSNNPIIKELFFSMINESKKKDKYFLELCNHKIIEILVWISRSQTTKNDDLAMYNLIKKIDSNPQDEYLIQEMAKQTSYSYDHFRYKFKSITGLPPADYVVNKRIEKACELLESGIYSCTYIAQECGFCDSAQFSKQFKKRLSITPKQYIQYVQKEMSFSEELELKNDIL